MIESFSTSRDGTSHKPTLHVVGVGASAGGVEALEELFVHVPEDPGMAFVVIQHLSPDFKSLVTELIARKTRLPVHPVEDGMKIAPDNVYVLPPGKAMILSGGRLLLSDEDRAEDFPIDLFLRSLAQDAGERAIAVILSGSGSDGSRGIRDVHEAGGLVIAQDADTTKFAGMPQSARDSGVVDLVLPPALIPRALARYAQKPHLPRERQLLESVMGSAHDCIYFKDSAGCFIRLNQAMARRLGVADPAQAVGKTLADFLGQERAEAPVADESHVLATGEPVLDRDHRELLPDGSKAWWVTTTLPLYDEARNIIGTSGISRNATDEKSAEERMREGLGRRDRFLAMLSHELRNPLGAILNAVHVLDRTTDSDRRTRSRHVIERQAAQMARLLDDLLDVSRVAQNKIELRKKVFDLRDSTEEALGVVHSRAQQRGVELEAAMANEPLWVEGDPSRLQQIQVNLLSNAVKYTAPGGTVTARARLADGEVALTVADTGAGLSREMLDSIFDLFFQSGSTLDRADGGIGVGLTLARSLVEMHGGRILARSDGPGKGSEFEVRLPAAPAPPAHVDNNRSKEQEASGNEVVLVEDNADSRDMLKELLQLGGYHVHAASDGRRGIQLILEKHPSVALVDIGLPGVDGFEVARQVRARLGDGGVYLVALTGYGRPADREASAAAGFNEHLVKPLDQTVLAHILDGSSRESQPRKPAKR